MLAAGDGGMNAPATTGVFLFGGFRLDHSGLSRRDQSGAFIPVSIGSRALEILGVLVARPGELVTRDEITNAVWPGTGSFLTWSIRRWRCATAVPMISRKTLRWGFCAC